MLNKNLKNKFNIIDLILQKKFKINGQINSKQQGNNSTH